MTVAAGGLAGMVSLLDVDSWPPSAAGAVKECVRIGVECVSRSLTLPYAPSRNDVCRLLAGSGLPLYLARSTCWLWKRLKVESSGGAGLTVVIERCVNL